MELLVELGESRKLFFILFIARLEFLLKLLGVFLLLINVPKFKKLVQYVLLLGKSVNHQIEIKETCERLKIQWLCFTVTNINTRNPFTESKRIVL